MAQSQTKMERQGTNWPASARPECMRTRTCRSSGRVTTPTATSTRDVNPVRVDVGVKDEVLARSGERGIAGARGGQAERRIEFARRRCTQPSEVHKAHRGEPRHAPERERSLRSPPHRSQQTEQCDEGRSTTSPPSQQTRVSQSPHTHRRELRPWANPPRGRPSARQAAEPRRMVPCRLRLIRQYCLRNRADKHGHHRNGPNPDCNVLRSLDHAIGTSAGKPLSVGLARRSRHERERPADRRPRVEPQPRPRRAPE